MSVRIGWGYDAHRLIARRRLVLGGVAFPDFPRGCDVNAYDGDVVVHAMADAVLGALAAGDVGDLLSPHGDAGESSLKHADLRPVLAAHRATVTNLDCTIVAIAPPLAPAVQAIRANLASALLTDPARVSVKAKTNDGLGATGRGEAIVAVALAQLEVRARWRGRLWTRRSRPVQS
jgi:2-C-methyl-D-erythritol 2,4-cyclodiphosphate synthase